MPRVSTYRLCIHHHVALLEELQVFAVCDVAKPHADPEVGWECVLSFTFWVLSQRQISPTGVHSPRGDRDVGKVEAEGGPCIARMGHTHCF